MNKEIREQLKGYELTEEILDERFKNRPRFKTSFEGGVQLLYDSLYYYEPAMMYIEDYKLYELIDWIKTLLGTGVNIHHPILHHINKEKAVNVIKEIIEIIRENEEDKKQKIKKHYDKEYTMYDMVESSKEWPIIDEMKKQEKENEEKCNCKKEKSNSEKLFEKYPELKEPVKQKATLKLADGREIEVEISEEELKKFQVKKSPYERVKKGKYYYTISPNCSTYNIHLENDTSENLSHFENANYFIDKDFAEKCARADLLMRKLRKFAIENNEIKRNPTNTAGDLPIWSIVYDNSKEYNGKNFSVRTYSNLDGPNFGSIFFTYETCKKAIVEFKDELIWYFTEYLKIYE